MTGRQKKYSNEDISVIWKPDVCSHSTKCWKASLAIFNPQRRPWIDLSSGTTPEIIKIVNNCPSGALSYRNNSDFGQDSTKKPQVE